MLHFLLSLLCFTGLQVVTGCPLEDRIGPSCFCKDLGNGPMLACHDLLNPEELIGPINATKELKMFSLTISESSLQYLPSELFLGTSFQKILLIQTELMGLSDSDKAFQGLEDELQELRIVADEYVTNWDWLQLRNLRQLYLLDVQGVSMHSIIEPFPALKSLQVLGLEKAEISFITSNAFKALENLKYIVLKENNIKVMERSMLPRPAEKLVSIDLSHNQLSSLPDDFFEGMPKLKSVYLDNNKFVTMNEATFKWPVKHLETLSLTGNELRCDCRMRWISLDFRSRGLEGRCEGPDAYKDSSLRSVNLRNLVCPKKH